MKCLPSETRQAMFGSSAGIMFSWFRIGRHLWSFCKSVEWIDSCWLTVDLFSSGVFYFSVVISCKPVDLKCIVISVNSFVPVDILIYVPMLLCFFTKYVDRIRYADSIAPSFHSLFIPTKHPIDSNLVLTSKGLLTITKTYQQVSNIYD